MRQRGKESARLAGAAMFNFDYVTSGARRKTHKHCKACNKHCKACNKKGCYKKSCRLVAKARNKHAIRRELKNKRPKTCVATTKTHG